MKLHVRSTLFRSPRSKLLAAVASFAAIALFTLILPATVASGESASTSTLQEAGVLRLALGAQDNLKFHEPNGAGGYLPASAQQSISASGCRLALSGQPLVSYSALPNNAFPGFFDNAIGVGGPGGNGQPCGKIDPGQTLTMNLGSGLAGKMIDYAEIDLELKFGGAVTVTGYVVQGTTATPVVDETYTSTGSDSGPDSGDLDNYRVRFPESGTTAVNRLVFSVGSAGSGSLEGGADGTGPCDAADADGCDPAQGGSSLGQALGTTDTLFHLLEADGVLGCGQTAPTQGGGGTPTNVLERLDNDGGPACTPIAFNLDSGPGVGEGCPLDSPQCILLQKDLLGQNARFFWTVTWVAETAEYPEAPTLFDFGDGYHPLEPCGPDADLIPPLIPTLPENGDPWCIVETHTVEQLDGKVIVTEKYFGSGDPLGKRG